MMKRRDCLAATTPHRHRLVATGDACILVKFHHTYSDRVRRLSDMNTDGTLDAIHDSCRHHIIGIVLNRIETGNRRQFRRRHASMESQTNDNWASIGQALIQRIQRGNNVEASGSVRDADGGAVEIGPAAQGPGWVLCCTNSQIRATQKGSVDIIGGHQGSSHVLVLGS